MKLGNICKYRNEKIELKNINREQYISTDNMLPNFAGIRETKSFPNVKKVNKYYRNDILLSNIRPYFKKMIISDVESGCSSDVLVIKTISKDVNPEFLYYRLRAEDFFDYVILTSKGTKMPRGDKTAIMDFQLSLPNISIQNKVVKILKSIDKKIKQNNKINNNLHQYCIDFFERLFNDFESEDTLENLCYEITRGYTKNYVERSKIINLNQKVNKGELLEKNYYKFLDENQTIPNNKFAKKNDILLNSLGQGTLGRIHLFGEEVNNVVVDQHITVLRTGNRINPYYLYYLLITPEYKNKIESSVTGTTGMLMINISNVRNLRVPIPTREKLDIFEQVVCPIREKITYNNLENEKLSDLRDALLPKLMNGEIDLENIEI